MSESKPSFTCIARGKTYPVKDELKSYAFIWIADDQVWRRDQVSEYERRQFEDLVANGSWSEVELEFSEEKESDCARILREAGEAGEL